MSVRWQLRPMGAGRQGASVAGRLKAYPDTNPFRSGRESQVARVARHGARRASRKRLAGKADSSPLKRMRNDKMEGGGQGAEGADGTADGELFAAAGGEGLVRAGV